MANLKRTNLAYGIGNPLQQLAPEPIISTRNPGTSDSSAIGAIWVNKSTNDFYVLTSIAAGLANWQAPATSGSTVASLTVTGGAGDVLIVNAGGDTNLGGDLAVVGNSVLTGNLTVNGDTIINGDFDITSTDALSFTSTSNTDPAISFTTNGGITETMILTVTQGTALDSLNLVSTVGGILIEANGLVNSAAVNLVASVGGVQFDAVLTSAWNVVGASADIQLNATGGSIAATATEAAADAIVLSASTAGGGIDITAAGGAAADIDIVNTAGSVNISGGEAIATAVVISAVAGGIDITAAGGATTGDIDVSTDGSVTVSSTENAASNIYLHSNGGVTETIKIHSDLGTSASSIDVLSDVGGITLTAGLSTTIVDTGAAGVDTSISNAAGSVNITAGEAIANAMVLTSTNGGIDLTAGGGAGLDIDIANTAGSVNISAGEDTIGSIAISTAGGTSETIVVSSTLGTSASSVDINSTSGGITLTSGLASTDAVNVVASAGGVDIDGALEVNITSSEASVADAVTISASHAAGGITLDSGATPGVTFTNGTQSFQMLTGSGSPNTVVTASQGSMYIDVAGATSTTILFVNTDGATAWVGVGV